MAANLSVSTLVFMDLETTGFMKAGVYPEITELFMLAIGQEEFMSKSQYKVQNSIKLAFKPDRPISKKVTELTGLCADNLKGQNSFNEKTIELLNLFFSRLKKPVCILAHNGNKFDFRVLQAQLKGFQKELMDDLWCADTLEGFKDIDKQKENSKQKASCVTALENLSISEEKPSYALQEVYKRTFGDDKVVAHRAESDVHMMYKIALKDKKQFLIWVNEVAKEFKTSYPI